MSRWRASKSNSLLVISDVHGSIDVLNKILNRILPLRKNNKYKDRLVFTGDYIDRNENSYLVLDKLIELETLYPDQVIFIRGNHEQMMLNALDLNPNKKMTPQDLTINYRMWQNNGGYQTIAGYLKRAGVDPNTAMSIMRYRVVDFIPDAHIKFLQNSLKNYWEYENYIFVHAGCDPTGILSEQSPEFLMWDRSLFGLVMKHIEANIDLPWKKTVIVGHNVQIQSGDPVIDPKFLMLDCMPHKLLCVELHSMKAMAAYSNKNRLVAYKLKRTSSAPIRKPNSFKRLSHGDI